MPVKRSESDEGVLENLVIDLKVLCERCRKDIPDSDLITVDYFMNEFNRILAAGKEARSAFFEGTEYVIISQKIMDTPNLDYIKVARLKLCEVEASASKILARIIKHQDTDKDKIRAIPSRSMEISKAMGKQDWKAIENEYSVSKRAFGKKINFVSGDYKRRTIFRDVEQAYTLASSGFSKPAVILAGGVIEELLRLYLKEKGVKPKKDDFNAYILACEQEGLLKTGIARLSDSARHFRNLVHLSKEKTKKHTISKTAAIGAVTSIFTIANDF